MGQYGTNAGSPCILHHSLNATMYRKGSSWELSLVTEDSGRDSATWAGRRHPGVVTMLSKVCGDRAASPDHKPLARRVPASWGRRGRCAHLAGWVTEAAGPAPVCGLLHFALFGPRCPVLGGGGLSAMDPLLSSFWG